MHKRLERLESKSESKSECMSVSRKPFVAGKRATDDDDDDWLTCAS